MTHTVWKYTLAPAEEQILELPRGAKPVRVQNQNASMVMYWEVDNEQPKRKQKVFIVGTGQPLPKGDINYVDTVMLLQGTLVFHIYTRAYYEPLEIGDIT